MTDSQTGGTPRDDDYSASPSLQWSFFVGMGSPLKMDSSASRRDDAISMGQLLSSKRRDLFTLQDVTFRKAVEKGEVVYFIDLEAKTCANRHEEKSPSFFAIHLLYGMMLWRLKNEKYVG